MHQTWPSKPDSSSPMLDITACSSTGKKFPACDFPDVDLSCDMSSGDGISLYVSSAIQTVNDVSACTPNISGTSTFSNACDISSGDGTSFSSNTCFGCNSCVKCMCVNCLSLENRSTNVVNCGFYCETKTVFSVCKSVACTTVNSLNSCLVASSVSNISNMNSSASDVNVQLKLQQHLFSKENKKLSDSNHLLQEQVNSLENQNQALKDQIQILLKQKGNINIELKKKVDKMEHLEAELKTKSEMNLYELVSNEGDVIKIRPYSSKSKTLSYLRIRIPAMSSDVSSKCIDERCAKMKQLLNILGSNPEEQIKIMSKFFTQNKNLIISACEKANIFTPSSLDVKSVTDFLLLLNVPMAKLRSIRTFFRNKGFPYLFPPENKIRENLSTRSKQENIQAGLAEAPSKSGPVSVPFATTSDLKQQLETLYSVLKENSRLVSHENFNNEIWFKIGADKGGNSTKLVYEIVNSINPNSYRNTTVISLFEGEDSVANLWKFFGPLKAQFLDIQTIGEFPVQKFVFGDYHWICDQLGHQGAASSFPCVFCLVPQDVLRRRGDASGQPHTPKILDINGQYV